MQLWITHTHDGIICCQHLINHGYLPKYCKYFDAVFQKSGALQNCFGFEDGTVGPVSRPGKNQRVLYNGHKKVHAIKFQSVPVPNGLLANLYGPIEGKRHDTVMLADSGLYN